MLHVGSWLVTDGGDRSSPFQPDTTGCGGCLGNRGKGTRKPQFGGPHRRAGMQHTCQETRNLRLKAIMDKSGPVTIQQHLQKIYNGKKAALKERHWIPDSDGTYDLERIRLSRPSHISEVNWDAQIGFWNDPRTVPGLPKINKTGQKEEDEMLRLQGLGSNTETGVPYTEDEIMAIVRGGKQRGHFPVLVGATAGSGGPGDV
ncbi:hypothetical protein Tco_0117155 [Tanacetum coccineum]